MLRSIRSKNMRYVFLTNGGGAHEDAKVASLSKRLGLSIDEDVIRDRVILSHTPMRGWADEVKKQTVLITGSHPETARKIANESILVWNDPRDWSLDIQVIHDLLVSHNGYLGTLSSRNGNRGLPNNGWQQDGQPELWISNLDLVWKTEYPVNRFGTGAFLEALKGVWSAVTNGAELHYNALGKPSQFTYDYAHTRLLQYYSTMKGGREAGGRKDATPLRRVYMIGDNPESDIRGANEYCPEDGTEWVSILVRTGVWTETETEREPRYKPGAIVDDVVDGIVWALRNEGVDVDRKTLLAAGGKE
ncbi:putative CDP-alcohol phosphatidyltransferase class-I family protein C22A12.08c [Metarhizium anisopliae]|nr:putative CDP-alcohol phosphatidyltransferase class-I family protein C22A12.08c [Metarhizium anisopliae]